MKNQKLREVTNFMQLGENAIRVFTDENQTLWMPAKQIIESLGRTWAGNSLDAIPNEWVKDGEIAILEGNRTINRMVILINTKAFQRLVHRSDHPHAIEYCNQLADFEDKLRLGVETKQDIENLRQSVQLTFSFFTGVKEQRQVNHKWNLSPKTVNGTGPNKPPNELYWNNLYRMFWGMPKKAVALWLKDRFDIPQHVLDRSGIDGLRWDPSVFGYAIAFSTYTNLRDMGASEEEVNAVIKECEPSFVKLGKVAWKLGNTKDEYLQKIARKRLAHYKSEMEKETMEEVHRLQLHLAL